MIPRFVQLLFLTLYCRHSFLPRPRNSGRQESTTWNMRFWRLAATREPVATHQSEIAVKMRLEIVKWVAMGRSDREILDTYVGLYGSKVLVDPRTVPRGWTPFFPWLVLILGMFLVVWLLRRWRAAPRTPAALSTTEVPNLPDFDDE